MRWSSHWFGFIVADGHIDRKLVITLKPDDATYLELFKEDVRPHLPTLGVLMKKTNWQLRAAQKRDESIIALFKMGKNISEIAAEVDCLDTFVLKTLVAVGISQASIDSAKPGPCWEKGVEIVALYCGCHDIQKVSQQTGCDEEVIIRILRANEII